MTTRQQLQIRAVWQPTRERPTWHVVAKHGIGPYGALEHLFTVSAQMASLCERARILHEPLVLTWTPKNRRLVDAERVAEHAPVTESHV